MSRIDDTKGKLRISISILPAKTDISANRFSLQVAHISDVSAQTKEMPRAFKRSNMYSESLKVSYWESSSLNSEKKWGIRDIDITARAEMGINSFSGLDICFVIVAAQKLISITAHILITVIVQRCFL